MAGYAGSRRVRTEGPNRRTKANEGNKEVVSSAGRIGGRRGDSGAPRPFFRSVHPKTCRLLAAGTHATPQQTLGKPQMKIFVLRPALGPVRSIRAVGLNAFPLRAKRTTNEPSASPEVSRALPTFDCPSTRRKSRAEPHSPHFSSAETAANARSMSASETIKLVTARIWSRATASTSTPRARRASTSFWAGTA